MVHIIYIYALTYGKHDGTNFQHVTQENWFIPSNEGFKYM